METILKELVERIIEEQFSPLEVIFPSQFNCPVDIRLTNGNILLRAFRIIALQGDYLERRVFSTQGKQSAGIQLLCAGGNCGAALRGT